MNALHCTHTHTHTHKQSIIYVLIVCLQAEYGSVKKPEEIFHIMEHFCLGRRRLHLFGSDDTIRPGIESCCV